MKFNYIILLIALLNVRAVAQTVGINKGVIVFSKGCKLDKAHIKKLDSFADHILYNPLDKAVIMSCGNSSKVTQQTSWDRTNTVIEYMVEKRNISRDRFIFQYGQAGIPNSVTFRIAESGEEGPSFAAPPFPNLNTRRK